MLPAHRSLPSTRRLIWLLLGGDFLMSAAAFAYPFMAYLVAERGHTATTVGVVVADETWSLWRHRLREQRHPAVLGSAVTATTNHTASNAETAPKKGAIVVNQARRSRSSEPGSDSG
jgi:hypothetical protein